MKVRSRNVLEVRKYPGSPEAFRVVFENERESAERVKLVALK